MILENIQLALSSLRSNKMRALLTMLGIIIGIMSIITIVIIGDAMTASVADELAILGGDNIMVNVQERLVEEPPEDEFFGPGGNPFFQPLSLTGRRPLSEDLISDAMVADMRDFFGDDILGVSVSHSNGRAEARDMELSATVNVIGVNSDFFLANDVELLYGRLISESDLSDNSMTAVVSDRFVSRMFPSGISPIGQQVRVFMPNVIDIYTIIGVYRFEESGFMPISNINDDVPTNFFTPITTARHGSIEHNHTSITVVGAPHRNIHALTAEIQAYFDFVYSNNEFWRVNVLNMASVLDTIANTMNTISLAIALIAGISLIVGGIGVMNIMLVSVTERTREIGTRKALGAKNYHIQFQFVMEALIIALIGGIIGMLLGIAAGTAVTQLFEAPLVVSPTVIFGSMLFSMIIGIFFGIYPANKAAKLDPIEALRYE